MKTYDEILALMLERYEALSGFPADSASDIGIRMRVLARQVHELAAEAEELRRQVFPQTGGGTYLNLHAETRGLERKPALYAEGTLRFSRQNPATGDMVIPAGVLCATRLDPQTRFETIEDAILPEGEREIDVPARAAEPGRNGNVAAGSVCLMITAAPGFTAVTNPAAFSGGADEEGDEELRTRLLESYRNISNGTNSAYYYDLAMKQGGVVSANVLPRARGRGTVDVVIAGVSPEIEARAVADLQAELEKQKEINVDILVRAAAPRPCDITVEVAPQEGADFAAVCAAAEKALRAYLESLHVGQPLLLAQAGARLLPVSGVYNYRILVPGGDVYPESHEIIVPGQISAIWMVTP